MSELERLDEALEWWRYDEGAAWIKEAPEEIVGHVSVAMGAARAYRDLLANGQRVVSIPCAHGEYDDLSHELTVAEILALSVYPKEAENGPIRDKG